MKYILDTNICVYWLKGYKNIEKKALGVGLEIISISFITLSELYYGHINQKKKRRTSLILENSRKNFLL